MQKKLFLKQLIINGIVFLLVITSTTTAITINENHLLLKSTFDGTILYVGGSGLNNYTHIQDAINNASSGDTVFVYDDSSPYYEEVRINKSISLIGEQKETTIIDTVGGGDAVAILVSHVMLTGFTLQNSSGYLKGGINLVDVYIHDVMIYDNIITHNTQGVYIFRASNITLYNNKITQNEVGIQFLDGSTCVIRDNLINNNTKGLSIVYGESDSMVSHNHIRDNDIGLVADCSKLTIQSNNFINNRKQTSVTKGVHLLSCYLLPQTTLQWTNNYWDTWEKTTRKPILCIGFIYIQFLFHERFIDILLFIIPSIQFDKAPVLEPYEINIP